MRDILIIDDEVDIRNLIKGILEDEGYGVAMAGDSDQAYAELEENKPDLIVLDIWLQGSKDDGMDILQNIKLEHPSIPVIMISGHGTIETAVQAIQKGAYDFIEKPFKSDRLLLMIQRALENAELRKENQELKLQTDISFDLIGQSQRIELLQNVLSRVAPTNSRILLTGEAGTGKNVAARFIHKNSTRNKNPFLILNCATLRPERLEIELFGSEAGSDSGNPRIGVLEQANGGTLLLDEVSDMPIETQSKIVRVLQSSSFQRVGGEDYIDIDVRIIASTNRDLEKAITEGTFREDLYYRLNVVPIEMPSLRDRADDIPFLVEHFFKQLKETNGLTAKPFSEDALDKMQRYQWPGNVRQLKNVLEWVMIMHAHNDAQLYDLKDLPPEIAGKQIIQDNSKQEAQALIQDLLVLPLREAREQFEKDYLQSQIQRFDGNVSKTAKFVGMERSALHRKLKSLDIDVVKDTAKISDHLKTGS